MQAKAATITVTAHVDVDTLKPDLDVEVKLGDGFEFLASNRDVLASWLHKVADDLAKSG